MFVRRMLTGGVAFGLALGSLLLASGSSARAQRYVGDEICSVCHATEYANYKQHGHPWMQVHFGGVQPATNPFDAVGVPLPALPTNATWADIQDVFGNFKDGNGDWLMMGGKYVGGGGTWTASSGTMPARCNNCHNTGFDATGHAYGDVGVVGDLRKPGIQGSWALPGIQCERCHGAGPTMALPDKQICRDCHSSGDSKFRIPFDPATELFTNHHPEGDEYRRSPHKDQGCVICHDPHKSVWHDKGGVKYADPTDEKSISTMCTKCHNEKVRGPMGDPQGEQILCLDCHMPEKSGVGERVSHLFRINTAPLDAASNYKTEKNDSGKDTKYWMNFDGTTSQDGQSFITLDMACGKCHDKMTLQQMSGYAPFVHHNYGMIDLTINGNEVLSNVAKTEAVRVSLGVYPGAKAGTRADWVFMMQGPKGWYSFNGTQWVRGQTFWARNVPLKQVPKQVVFNGRLAPGNYTFYAGLYPKKGVATTGSVPVRVTP